MLTRQMLANEFSALGLKPGMHIMVHSSLKSLGHVEGGAGAVIGALMDVLTPEGTLMMPSFNHMQCYRAGEIFDLASTPTINGLIPDTFWRMNGVLRSVNPTHSFAAWGKNAQRYTQSHQSVPAMGQGSPLGLLMEDGGYTMLLGVTYRANTFHHFVEMTTGAPCLGEYSKPYDVRLADGSVIKAHTWRYRAGRCPINDANHYAPYMQAVHTQKKVGDATVTLYRLKDGYPIIARFLKEGVEPNPPCHSCPIRPNND